MLFGVLIVFSLFAAQLVRLQGLDAASVSAAALDMRLRTATIPAARGTIVDVNGFPLAESVERKHITVDSSAVVEYKKEVEGTRVTVGAEGAAQDIAELTGRDPAALLDIMRADPDSQWAYLAKDVSPQVWQQVKALGIPGIYAEDYYKRSYSRGRSHAPLLGWVGSGEQPAGGIELVYNDLLTGTPGTKTYEQGGVGPTISTAEHADVPAVAGRDVRLTIDSDLQWYAYDVIEQRVKEAQGKSGYVVITDIDGNLLALASYPSFDPADSSQTSEGMRNAAIEDAYEPGSTGKLITAAAALEEGLVEVDTPIILPNRLPRAGVRFKDSHDPDNPYVTFAGSLATSSNMGTILYGEHLDDDTFYEYERKFGMGSTSGLGLPGESPGLVWAPEDWSATTKYTMLFGQGLTSNALQQIGVFQTIANDGVHIPPRVVAGTMDEDGRFVEEPEKEGTRVVSEETANTLTSIMEHVPTSEGTAPLAAVDGYRVAGKTSTADRVNPKTGQYDSVTSAFVGFAPADDPQIIVSVTVQAPKVGKWGGEVAGPAFADVMRFALQQRGIEPSTTESPDVPLTYDPDDHAPGEPRGVTLGDIAIKDERDD